MSHILCILEVKKALKLPGGIIRWQNNQIEEPVGAFYLNHQAQGPQEQKQSQWKTVKTRRLPALTEC